MKTQKIFLVLTAMLAFLATVCATGAQAGEVSLQVGESPPVVSCMPLIIENALSQIPANAMSGVGVANNATLAQIFARAEIGKALSVMVRGVGTSSDDGWLVESMSRMESRHTLATIGMRATDGSTKNQGYLVATDIHYLVENAFGKRGSFEEFRIDIYTASENRKFMVRITSYEIYPEVAKSSTEMEGLNETIRNLQFITGVYGIYYWEVIESRDTQGYFWVLVIRHGIDSDLDRAWRSGLYGIYDLELIDFDDALELTRIPMERIIARDPEFVNRAMLMPPSTLEIHREVFRRMDEAFRAFE